MIRLSMFFAVLLGILFSLPAFATSVLVSWNANTEVDLAGYKVYQGTSSGTYGDPLDVGKATSYQLTLTPDAGMTYYFAVSAYDTSGNEGPKSDEASIFIRDSVPPAQPKGLIASIIDAIVGWFKALFGVV